MTMNSLLKMLILGALILSSRRAGAVEELGLDETGVVRQMALDFSAPEPCPNEDAFRELVQRRLPGFEFSAPSSQEAVRIVVTKHGEQFQGTFQIVPPSENTAGRIINAADCAELLDALSVVVAIALNPEKSQSEVVEQPTTKALEPSASGSKSPDELSAENAEIQNKEATKVPTLWHQPMEVNRTVSVEKGKLSFDNKFSFDLQFGGNFGLIRGAPVMQFDLSFRWELFLVLPQGKEYQVGLMPRVRVTYWDSTYKVDDFKVRMQGYGFAGGLCTTPYFNPVGWALLLCGEYGSGLLGFRQTQQSTPVDYDNTLQLNYLNLSLEAEYHLFSVFHFNLRTGVQFSTFDKSQVVDNTGAELAGLHSPSFFATTGLGLRF